ncbi:transcriptional regulator domain-containing protein [Shinella daejeonensis]|uniref:transcriptional regulator domain-containing protein n=1 Tax=Shinella daejeonensis TaxID=659017 RepID=UPI0020C7E4D0|nr:DUF6499 domain-containing protein [Shinella daejeonensis]
MRPDTSDWRDDSRYDYFDSLPVEGLAWECLRRYVPYQELYSGLVNTAAEATPLPKDAEQLWGLRFRCQAGPVRAGPRCAVVALMRWRRSHADAPTRVSAAWRRCIRRPVRRRA